VKHNAYPHVVIAGATRIPVSLKCGTLSNFSAEALGVEQELNLDREITNVNSGAAVIVRDTNKG
jgi:hypothetical protein